MLIKFQDLVNKYSMKIHGILHIGAHECEEMTDYLTVVPKNKILWLEANPLLVRKCKQQDPEIVIHQAIISDKDDIPITLNITNNSQSSSILDLKEHAIDYPHIYYNASCTGRTRTVLSLYNSLSINHNFANFLNIDIQGAELLALKGMGDLLGEFEYLYLEVNVREMYAGCALLPDIDSFLAEKGFYRAETDVSPGGWGDAFYIRKHD